MSGVYTINCQYLEKSEVNRKFKNFYTCFVIGYHFDSNKFYQFDLKGCKNPNNVHAIAFEECDMEKIPHNFPWYQFPKLQHLLIENSNLKSISLSDFKGIKKRNLKGIYFHSNYIEYLPGNLLNDMNNLKIVSFFNNEIKYIEPELVVTLRKLYYVDFEENVNINMIYDGTNNMDKLIKEILVKCKVPEHYRELKNPEWKPEPIKTEYENGIACDLINALKDETTKDFTITVGDQEFKVHKFLLIARSPVFAEMIRNNPDATKLNLEHIPLDIFKQVVEFLYDDKLPQEGSDFKDIFIASYRLKINKLKNYAGKILAEHVNKENAFEMLSFANKYDSDELRVKAFEFVRKIFPNQDIKDDVAKDQEKIQKLCEIKKFFDEI